MNNTKCAREFAAGKIKSTGSHCHVSGDLLYSYQTAIALRLADNVFLLDSRRYSPTTSRHLGCVRRAVLKNNLMESVLPLPPDESCWRDYGFLLWFFTEQLTYLERAAARAPTVEKEMTAEAQLRATVHNIKVLEEHEFVIKKRGYTYETQNTNDYLSNLRSHIQDDIFNTLPKV